MTGYQKYKSSGMQKTAGGLVEWGVKSNWGTLKNYNSHGKRYVVGRQGSNYSLVVKNLCHSSLEVVLSVDGLDVSNGKPASWKQRGYIIPAGETLNIKGFRTSESAVAAFKFSSVAGSYSNLRHGKSRNVGVIGLAVFTQRGVDLAWHTFCQPGKFHLLGKPLHWSGFTSLILHESPSNMIHS